MKTYSLGSDHKEQKRLEQQQLLYGDAKFLVFNKTDTVCEIGCGSGANLWIASRLTEGQFIGIDIQKEQVDACRKKSKQLSLNNTNFYQAPGQKLPLKNESADLTFCRLVLIHVPDCQNIIQEMRRITKIGGKVLAIEPAVQTYTTTKTSLLKCFKARSEYVYRAGFGTIDIARNFEPLFQLCQLNEIKIIKHKIEVDGEELDRLRLLLKNWLMLIKSVQNELLEHKSITNNDLLLAEKEINALCPDDYVYQELWIAEGIKN